MKRNLVLGVAFLLAALPAEASHFRGGALVPSINATGLLTVTATTFWRPTALGGSSLLIDGLSNGITQIGPDQIDTSDTRFAKVTEVFQKQLSPGSGLHSISFATCCRVGGVKNAAESDFSLNSQIFWNGTSANTPIIFNFATIQPQVVRGTNYSQPLGATSGNGGTLTYNQTLNQSISSQPPGFAIDPNTGLMTIPQAHTATYLDNSSNPGADYAFSGNIINSDGSSVEFDWLFDAVNLTANLAPMVTDHVVNALVGQTVTQVVTGDDPNEQNVTLAWAGMNGPTPAIAPVFVPGPAGDPASGTITWDTTGSAPGTYVLAVRGSDGSITDIGGLTVNLVAPLAAPVPEPATLALVAAGVLGVGWMRRRRSHVGR